MLLSVLRRWGAPVAWWHWPALRRSPQHAATPVSIDPSLAPRKGRIALVAQWLIAAVLIVFAGRELARQWEDVAPALRGVRLDWWRILASGAVVVATYLILVEAWRATLR